MCDKNTELGDSPQAGSSLAEGLPLESKTVRLILFVVWFTLLMLAVIGATSCDKVGFNRSREVEIFYHQYNAESVDILFVLDDSCSMSTILSNVESGILSLSSVEFPANTKMGVTYMSPAKMTGDQIDFEKPYTRLSTGVPGFLSLVNRSTVADYMSLDVSAYDPEEEGKQNFPVGVCAESWFDPKQVNGSGQACLSGAMQTPLYCTGVEEGVWSLYQLIENYNRKHLALFRPESLVLVLFVSDTHAPGVANYYGKSNSPSSPLSLSEITNKIKENSPGIASVKFSGVVPVPKVGDRHLDGLKVVGGVPQSDEEAHINSEGFNDYAYLPLIRETGGVALHAKRNDWSEAMGDLIKDARVISNLTLRLSRAVERVTNVWVDGKELGESDFRLEPDHQTVYVLRDLSPRQLHEIKVEYLP